MKEDCEGFLYPNVDTDKCVDCKQCKAACDSMGQNSISSPKAYAAYANDAAIREASSSGGIFSLLTEAVLNKGGVVYGAAFDENFDVRHVVIDDISQLPKLRGSKYVQSVLGESLADVKRLLASGRTVLFSGTPCQIGGLKAYLSKDYPSLITVDLVCHGAPSPKVWRMYLDIMKQRAQAPLQRISFRTKNSSWKRFAVSFTYVNDTAYLSWHQKDPYMRGFLQNLYLRPSCHNCRFKANNRASDITLADFWGIENVLPEMDDDKGTSVIIANTVKGQQILSEVKDKMRIIKVQPEVIEKYNTSICRSARAHPKRDEFFSAISNDGSNLLELIHRYTKDSIGTKLRRSIRYILKMTGLLPLVRKVKGR